MLDFLNKINTHPFTPKVDLTSKIQIAIEIIKSSPEDADPQGIIEHIGHMIKDNYLAWELFCFIPSVYCRLLLSEVTFSGEVIYVMKDGYRRKKLLTESEVFKQVVQVVFKRFEKGVDKDKLKYIIMNSLEYAEITTALDEGTSLEFIQLSPIVMEVPDLLF